MLIELTDRTGISTEKRRMAVDGLDRQELGIGNPAATRPGNLTGGKNISEDIGMTKVLALMRPNAGPQVATSVSE